MILEGLVTTQNADGGTNLSPMGPIVDERMERLILRPFATSTTYRNLCRTGHGVFHVVDDVELLAHAAVGTVDPPPAHVPVSATGGQRLVDCCRWYAFRVTRRDDSQERTTLEVEVVEQGRVRDMFGFNRAKHAVLEAAILATRIGLLPSEQIWSQFESLRPAVQKTGGPAELRAFAFLEDYVRRSSQ